MKKIISLFQRNYEGDRLVRDEIVSGAEWVQNGEGVATEKIDGTCCMVKEGKLYKRYDAKKGKTPPLNFIPAQDPDSVTGHWPGWLLVTPDAPEDRWHIEAFQFQQPLDDGTYELIGPKVQKNQYGINYHQLIKHGSTILEDAPRDYEGLKEYLSNFTHIEGIVWHHPDGRMVKIKSKDFGIKW